ncbi:MAG: PAS domain S-box protein [Anaerolineales bacterium]|nr:PAS domain S-box protein [Chloroflexota bacterium]MBL6981571.1 PAS domain S-box protein [Anaerolineales bacterium]
MTDQKKTKAQLIAELEEIRRYVSKLEQSEIERKRTQKELQENEKLLRKIAENLPNSYLSIIEKDLTVGFTSGQEFKNQNLDPEQFIGLTLEQVFGDKTNVVREHYQKTFHGKEQYFELFQNNQYQKYFTVPLRAENGTIPRILAVVENITERKRAEETLRKSEEKFRSMFENMQSGFALHEMVFDEAGKPIDYIFLDMNEAFEEQTSLKRENLIGRRVTEALPGIENDPADWIGTYGKVVLTGISVSFENYAESLNRLYSVVAYRPIEGQFATIFMDITERMQAEEVLRESEAQYRLLYESIPVGVGLVDQHGNFLSFNDMVLIPGGYDRDDIFEIGNVSNLYADPSQREDVLEIFQKQGFVDKHEVGFKRKDGTTYDAVISLTPIQIKGDFCIQALVEDITDRKQAEQALQEAHDTLEERVTERTEDLQKMVNLMAGREVRMAELKKAIKQLRTQLGEAGLEPVTDDPLIPAEDGY